MFSQVRSLIQLKIKEHSNFDYRCSSWIRSKLYQTCLSPQCKTRILQVKTPEASKLFVLENWVRWLTLPKIIAILVYGWVFQLCVKFSILCNCNLQFLQAWNSLEYFQWLSFNLDLVLRLFEFHIWPTFKPYMWDNGKWV